MHSLFAPALNYFGTINLKVIFGAVLLDVFANFALPGINLLTWLSVAIAVDFATGCLKTVVRNPKEFSSTKARSSVSKVIQYFGAVGVVVMVANMDVSGDHKETLEFVVSAVYMLLILIELISIIENFRDMDPNSVISVTIFSPLLSYLRKRVKSTQAAIPGADIPAEPEVKAPPIINP